MDVWGGRQEGERKQHSVPGLCDTTGDPGGSAVHRLWDRKRSASQSQKSKQDYSCYALHNMELAWVKRPPFNIQALSPFKSPILSEVFLDWADLLSTRHRCKRETDYFFKWQLAPLGHVRICCLTFWLPRQSLLGKCYRIENIWHNSGVHFQPAPRVNIT